MNPKRILGRDLPPSMPARVKATTPGMRAVPLTLSLRKVKLSGAVSMDH